MMLVPLRESIPCGRPAPLRQVAHDVAHVVLGGGDLDVMIGSRMVGPAFSMASFQASEPGDLERQLRGVDVVVLAVDQPHPEVDHRVAGQVAAVARLLDPLVDRRAEVVRDGAAEDLVLELVLLAALHRLDDDLAVGELAAAAGLLLVAPVPLGLALDRLAVGHLRRVEDHLHLVAALQLADDDLDVQLAGAGEQVLAGLRVAAGAQGGVLLEQAVQGVADLVLVALRLRLDGEGDRRRRDRDPRQLRRVVAVGESVAALRVLSLATPPMSPADQMLHGGALLALQRHQRAQAAPARRGWRWSPWCRSAGCRSRRAGW
jgi:hypothetical protein